MLRLAFDFIITWRETRTRPNAYIFLAFFHKKILNSQPTQTFYQHSCYLVEFGKINLDNN